MIYNNIVLIGFMYSGKSTIGKLLAKKLKYGYLDTDKLIEEKYNIKIREIFQNFGEDKFREYEKELINRLNTSNIENSVIITGGGLPIYNSVIKKLGLIIYLNRDINETIEKIKPKQIVSRPLFKDKNSVIELYNKRVPIYKKLADREYKLKDKNVEYIAMEIYKDLAHG